MAAEALSLTTQVFNAIIAEWRAHLTDIEQFVLRVEEEKIKAAQHEPGRRKYSFEEELNRWAREGCRKPAGWQSPDNGLTVYAGGTLRADALVTVPDGKPVAVEVKLVTNVTADKWIAEINNDTEKLSTQSLHLGLQIIACFDTFDLAKSPDWSTFLSRIHIWNVVTPMVYRQAILGNGVMLVKGWAIQNSQLSS